MNTSPFSFKCLQTATTGKWHNILQSDNYCKPLLNSISTDTRIDNNEALFIALSGERFDAHNFIKEALKSGSSALCLQKGRFNIDDIPSNIPILEVPDTLKAYQDIANFHRKRLRKLTLIAITGSNGKTSTKDILNGLLSHVFGQEAVYTTKANTNNLIGVPQNILRITDKHKFAVIELGSNHPGEIKRLTEIAQPDISVITSIGPAHLEFFHDINGVLEEKASIFSDFINPDRAVAVLPAVYKYNSIVTKWTKQFKVLSFGNCENADIVWKCKDTAIDKTCFKLIWKLYEEEHEISWHIPGIHQISNAAVAATVATAIGISPSTTANALETSTVSGMRMRISKINSITWINDAYNANPSSTKAGIDWLHKISSSEFKSMILILGDMLELGENTENAHAQIINYALKKLPDSKIIGVGTTMNKVIGKLKKNSNQTDNIFSFKNTETAIPLIRKSLAPNILIYLKASRGVRLESIEKFFCEQQSPIFIDKA